MTVCASLEVVWNVLLVIDEITKPIQTDGVRLQILYAGLDVFETADNRGCEWAVEWSEEVAA